MSQYTQESVMSCFKVEHKILAVLLQLLFLNMKIDTMSKRQSRYLFFD